MIKKIKIDNSLYYFDTNTLRLFKDKLIKTQNIVENKSKVNDKNLSKLVFNVANTCNLHCMYCYASCGNYGRQNNLMTESTAHKIIDELVKKYKSIQTVYFFGGEPTLNFSLIKYIVNELEKHFTISDYRIVTNATIVNDEMIKFFIDNNFKVYISIDGPKQINDYLRGSNFDKLQYVINNLKKSTIGNKLELICTYTKYHIDNISFDELVSFYEKLGVKYSISDVITSDKNLKIRKSIKQSVEQEKKYIDVSIERILTNSLNVGISHYLRNIIDALVYKQPTDIFCNELNEHSKVYDYNGDLYSCIRLLGTHKATDPIINLKNNKNNEKCKKCWAKSFCRDCVADVVLGNVKPCYEYYNCYKKCLYNYVIKKIIELYDKNKKEFNLFLSNYFQNYLF